MYEQHPHRASSPISGQVKAASSRTNFRRLPVVGRQPGQGQPTHGDGMTGRQCSCRHRHNTRRWPTRIEGVQAVSSQGRAYRHALVQGKDKANFPRENLVNFAPGEDKTHALLKLPKRPYSTVKSFSMKIRPRRSFMFVDFSAADGLPSKADENRD